MALLVNKDVFLSFQFKVEMIDSMYRLAKYRYECGNYVESASYLYFCQLVMSPTDKVRRISKGIYNSCLTHSSFFNYLT